MATARPRKRLTDRQVAVLAAIERGGATTLLELQAGLPGNSQSAIWRVVEALEAKALIRVRGDRDHVYVGGVEISPVGASRFSTTTRGLSPELRERLARLAAQPVDDGLVDAGLRRAILERDGHACVACGAAQLLEIDHRTPWSRGGPTTVDNLQTLCRGCNRRKGTRAWDSRGAEPPGWTFGPVSATTIERLRRIAQRRT